MKHKRTDLSGQLRQAIADSGLTRHALSKRAGVAYAVVFHFVAEERDVTLRTASKLAEVLGLELRPVGRESKRSKRTKRMKKR